MLIYNFACSAFLISHVRHALQKWSDQLWDSGLVVKWLTEIPEYYRIPVKNTGIPVKTPILALMKKRIYSEDDLEKPRGQFPYSPKFHSLVHCGVWSGSTLFVEAYLFQYLGSFNFLIRASFVCISDEKRLYKISLFFSRKGFPPRFHVTYRYEHVVS